MRKSLMAFGLLSFLSCDNVINNNKPQELDCEVSTLHSNFINIPNIKLMISEIEKWTRDGIIDEKERIEILGACGYSIKFGRKLDKEIYVWSGNSWHLVDIFNFPLHIYDPQRFILHYNNISPD